MSTDINLPAELSSNGNHPAIKGNAMFKWTAIIGGTTTAVLDKMMNSGGFLGHLFGSALVIGLLLGFASPWIIVSSMYDPGNGPDELQLIALAVMWLTILIGGPIKGAYSERSRETDPKTSAWLWFIGGGLIFFVSFMTIAVNAAAPQGASSVGFAFFDPAHNSEAPITHLFASFSVIAAPIAFSLLVYKGGRAEHYRRCENSKCTPYRMEKCNYQEFIG